MAFPVWAQDVHPIVRMMAPANHAPYRGPDLGPDDLQGVPVHDRANHLIGRITDFALEGDGRIRDVIIAIAPALIADLDPPPRKVVLPLDSLVVMTDGNGNLRAMARMTAQAILDLPEIVI